MGKKLIFSYLGFYRKNFVDGSDKLLYGIYYITVLKTRCKISFTPAGCKDPLFSDFVVLGNYTKALYYINSNWK